jgi:hypothetical protein
MNKGYRKKTYEELLEDTYYLRRKIKRQRTHIKNMERGLKWRNDILDETLPMLDSIFSHIESMKEELEKERQTFLGFYKKLLISLIKVKRRRRLNELD